MEEEAKKVFKGTSKGETEGVTNKVASKLPGMNTSTAAPPLVVHLSDEMSHEEFEVLLRKEFVGLEAVIHRIKQAKHGVVIEQNGSTSFTGSDLVQLPGVLKVLSPGSVFTKDAPISQEPIKKLEPTKNRPANPYSIPDDTESDGEEEGEEQDAAEVRRLKEREKEGRKRRTVASLRRDVKKQLIRVPSGGGVPQGMDPYLEKP